MLQKFGSIWLRLETFLELALQTWATVQNRAQLASENWYERHIWYCLQVTLEIPKSLFKRPVGHCPQIREHEGCNCLTDWGRCGAMWSRNTLDVLGAWGGGGGRS